MQNYIFVCKNTDLQRNIRLRETFSLVINYWTLYDSHMSNIHLFVLCNFEILLIKPYKLCLVLLHNVVRSSALPDHVYAWSRVSRSCEGD